MLTLITGGARSGKSRFAQALCKQNERVTYIATACPIDDEMRARIAIHRSARPDTWLTVEEPLKLAQAAAQQIDSSDVLLVDCLTLWLSNFLYELRDEKLGAIEAAVAAHAEQLVTISKRGRVVVVTNEVGSGIVPDSLIGRNFRDLQGLLNQQIAKASDIVYFVVSGIPTCIKGNGGLQ